MDTINNNTIMFFIQLQHTRTSKTGSQRVLHLSNYTLIYLAAHCPHFQACYEIPM
jgi:hypothetical protein